ncbi:uncharacterized protein LOC113240405 [Hyposmocoma kahamanoa]|uniref:uncharacterized protein LOC113240405 n=1 Tax=Hyposmocoma kahamanoa TaxID=1477025 RepID=UPI000E6D6989|nr:uncharacterized protein LOC113240405 [Hyposmocoma kahamanoa]
MTDVNIIRISFFAVIIFEVISAQDYFEMKHMQHLRTQNDIHLKEIPKKFEVKGNNVNREFQKYIDDIQNLAVKENKTIVYLVKVDVSKPLISSKTMKKARKMRANSKKYNVPLKKKNMRLSNYEIVMRKLIDTNSQNKVIINPVTTTDHEAGEPKVVETTKLPILKYKPIISRASLLDSGVDAIIRTPMLPFGHDRKFTGSRFVANLDHNVVFALPFMDIFLTGTMRFCLNELTL